LPSIQRTQKTCLKKRREQTLDHSTFSGAKSDKIKANTKSFMTSSDLKLHDSQIPVTKSGWAGAKESSCDSGHNSTNFMTITEVDATSTLLAFIEVYAF